MKILKFLHASDLRLHVPATCWTMREEAIRAELLEAVWATAERVFDAAVVQKVDFLLLTGEVMDSEQVGPRGNAFLEKQFRRLAEVGIPVYWQQTDAWEGTLPENVFPFPEGETLVRKFTLSDASKTVFLVRWDGATPDLSRYDLSKLPGEKLPERLTLALRREGEEPNMLAAYTAVGNSESRGTVADGGRVRHAPGTILGRTPEVLEGEPSPDFGVSLVRMDLDGEKPISIQFLPVETICWREYAVTVPVTLHTAAELGNWLETQLRERRNVGESVAKRELLRWRLSGGGEEIQPVLRQIYLENLRPERPGETRVGNVILERLCRVGDSLSPPVWSFGLEVEDAKLVPESLETSESFPGDFRRLAVFHRNNPTAVEVPGFVPHTLDLEAYLSASQRGDRLGTATRQDADALNETLREAEILGIDLFEAANREGGDA
ncbi:MAG: hypothetical protein Q4D98_09725 [Planctomycetia bacterium]|nr:hypothetical protein [Planctomycetia bacterium]